MQALHAGKHVLLEKPLCLTRHDLDEFKSFFKASSSSSLPSFLVGYNRRFSPYASKIKAFLTTIGQPFVLNYTMNAGYIENTHWVHGSQGGGRNIGEACHIYDLFTYLTDSSVDKISAHSLIPSSSHYRKDDNFSVSLTFSNGCVANLLYTSMGNDSVDKEHLDWRGESLRVACRYGYGRW